MKWENCKNILCIRPDNMGDLIMTGPAIRALMQSFNARITVLTSSMARGVIKHMPEIDDAIIVDLPWVKTNETPDTSVFNEVIDRLKEDSFDAAVIFTVYSQNPLPAAMLAYLAGIPHILAYCRENPYQLITDWVPDPEPYQYIRHQVQRDLDLVATVGATTNNQELYLTVNEKLWPIVKAKLTAKGIDLNRPWIILHPGVSEKKREYPVELWARAANKLINQLDVQILLTGSQAESELTEQLAAMIGPGSYSAGGMFDIDEYICLVKHSPLMIAVNTGVVHIAAAVGTRVVVLYAQTNPQHTPWNVENKVLEFPVPEALQSRNEVIAHVNKTLYATPAIMPDADDIFNAASQLINLSNSADQPSRGKLLQNQATAAS